MFSIKDRNSQDRGEKRERQMLIQAHLPLPCSPPTLPPHPMVRNNDHVPHLEDWVIVSMGRGNDFLS